MLCCEGALLSIPLALAVAKKHHWAKLAVLIHRENAANSCDLNFLCKHGNYNRFELSRSNGCAFCGLYIRLSLENIVFYLCSE